MDFRVRISPVALEELAEITKFIAVEDRAAASNLGGQLLDMVDSLNRFPNRYAKARWRSPRGMEYRKVTVGPYLIYFHVNERTKIVTVVHFWHGARQPPRF